MSLAQYDSIHDPKQEPTSNEYAPLPDGEYTCEIAECKLGVSKAGNDMISWALEVVEPKPFARRRIWKHSVLNTQPATLNRIHDELHKCGVVFTSWADLAHRPALLGSLAGAKILVAIVTKGTDTNGEPRQYYNIKKLLVPVAPAAQTVAEDEVPF